MASLCHQHAASITLWSDDKLGGVTFTGYVYSLNLLNFTETYEAQGKCRGLFESALTIVCHSPLRTPITDLYIGFVAGCSLHYIWQC